MIVTLPVSHLINADILQGLSGVQALEYKKVGPLLTRRLPALFHSNLGIVQDAFMDWFDEVVPALRDMGLQLFSFDCGPAAREVRIEDHTYIANSDVLTRDSLMSLTAERITHIRDRLGCRLAMENLNYYPTDAYKHVCEPDFIAEIVRSNDVGFVLDLAHAVVSAHNFGITPNAYLSALPLERVVEIHLSAPGMRDGTRDGLWRDLHGSPTHREYAMLASVLSRTPENPFIVIEHYASLDDVVRDYATLVQFINERDASHDGNR